MTMPYVNNFKKTLLMMSGGIDSSAALVHLLTKTTDVIHVHHVTLDLHSNRVKAETQAYKKIIDYCLENYRPFIETHSVIDTVAPNGSGEDDVYHLIYAAAQVVKFDHRAHHFNIVALGALNLDEEEYYVPGAKKRVRESEEFFKVIMNYRPEIPSPECRICYLDGWTKNDAWQTLPFALQKLVWYCRNPKTQNENFTPCNVCESCVHVREVVDRQTNSR